jgi:hypothetical protein
MSYFCGGAAVGKCEMGRSERIKKLGLISRLYYRVFCASKTNQLLTRTLKKETKLRGLCPRVNYTHRTTSDCRRS